MKGKRENWLWNWMAFFYDQFYRRFSPYQGLQRQIIQTLPSSPPNSGYILDAGCGTGLLSIELARRGYSVVGMDRSPAMLKRAREKGKKENLGNLHFCEGDLEEKLNFPEYSFQRMILVHSLYLMNHPQETLKNLSSLLPRGGEMILCNPSRLFTTAELWAGGRSFLKEAWREKGGLSLAGILTIFLAMGALNVMIQRRKKALYHCWNEGEMRDLIGSCGLQIRWLKKSCLADSHLLIWAIKER